MPNHRGHAPRRGRQKDAITPARAVVIKPPRLVTMTAQERERVVAALACVLAELAAIAEQNRLEPARADQALDGEDGE